MYEHLAELYAVIKATETLETAFTRDAITPEAYFHSQNSVQNSL
jgi:hypothetical protein